MNPNANFKQLFVSAAHALLFCVAFVGSVLGLFAMGILVARALNGFGLTTLPAAIVGTAIYVGLQFFVAWRLILPCQEWVEPHCERLFSSVPPEKTS